MTGFYLPEGDGTEGVEDRTNDGPPLFGSAPSGPEDAMLDPDPSGHAGEAARGSHLHD